MPTDVKLSFVSSDYDIYDNTTENSVSLTSKESAMLSSVAVLLLYRRAWDGMTDTEWDNLANEISIAIDKLDNAI